MVSAPTSHPLLLAIAQLRPASDQYVSQVVDLVLREARAAGVSDVHFVPTADGLAVDWRMNGVLQSVGTLPTTGTNVVARLKVLAQLLTYRTDVPQEGRIQWEQPSDVEMRLSTFPTLHGEKAVVRLFVGSGNYRRLDDLGLPDELTSEWRARLSATSGVMLITGPAGSGKTTLLYASLRELLHTAPERRSLVSLEDPIEAVVPGVAQSAVKPEAGFTYARGLRSILRQDPEVIMVGEVRDRETAETVFQAALSGHLVLTSFHAGSAADAVSRMSDMDIEPYLLRSGLQAVLCLRLLRCLCACCQAGTRAEDRLGLPVSTCRVPAGCPECRGTGYSARFPIAELLDPMHGPVGQAILQRPDSAVIEEQAVAAGMVPLLQQACDAVSRGVTSPAEVLRVFGLRPAPGRTTRPRNVGESPESRGG